MAMLLWFKRNQVELSTSNFFQGIGVPEFFDPARGRFISQSMQAVMEPSIQAVPTVDSIKFRVQPGIAGPSGDPVYQLRVMLDRLGEMKSFEGNWDSYGSEPPSDKAVSVARDLVWNVVALRYAASGSKALPYSIVPLSGAGVQIEWHGSTDSIEVQIGSDGRFGYLLTKDEASPARYREEHDDVSEAEILRLVTSAIS